MDLALSDDDRRFQDACRSWLADHVPRQPLPSINTREGFAAHVDWEKELFAAGWSVVSWPVEHGGRGASLVQWCLFEEAYWAADAPNRAVQNGIFLLGPTLFECGSEEQRRRILRPMAAAEYLWAQAWSEPEAGSDLAGLRSRARRVEGGWRLTGQKTWCTRGAFCDGIFGLFRTDPEAERHRGLTCFMVHLDQPGVTVRPVQGLDGDDAFVADRDVIGAVNEGWRVAMATTSSERGLSLRSPGRFLAAADRLLALYRRRPDPRLRGAVVRAWMDARRYQLRTWQTVTRMQAGESIGPGASLDKIFWSELDLHIQETGLALLGEGAERLDPDAEEAGRWLRDFAFALAGPIYAGTNEIQRNIVAARVLELPR